MELKDKQQPDRENKNIDRLILRSDEIITLNDFPVFSSDKLKEYFDKSFSGEELPPVPVMKLEVARKYLSSKEFTDFMTSHPNAKYIMLDGSHRTTAADLNGKPINAFVIDSDGDIEEAKQMVIRGELQSFAPKDTVEEIGLSLVEHFNKTKKFQTVKEKTERMVREKVIPQDMIDCYQNMTKV